ncbi:MAG: ATP-binding protein [Alcanivoracaceae bacterium]|nr:ATP-binding protein [Alcanivoracaceae bacterium]
MIAQEYRPAAMPWVMLSMVSLPFFVLIWLLVTSISDHFSQHRRLEKIADVFVSSQSVLDSFEDMAAYSSAHILISDQEINEKFEEARERVPAALEEYRNALLTVGDPANSDYARVLQQDWENLDLTTSRSATLDPLDAVYRLIERVYRPLSSQLYFVEINSGEPLRVSELMILVAEDFRNLREQVTTLHALSVYVALRGGYLGSADATRLDNAWNALNDGAQGLSQKLASLGSRGFNARQKAAFHQALEQIEEYLDYEEQYVLLADRVDIHWREADEQGRHVSSVLRSLSSQQLNLARQLLAERREEQLIRDILMSVGLLALYLAVAGIGVLFYRSREKMMQALMESRTKSQFLARMSHEIRTPLNGVIGLAELLRETNPDARQQEYIRLIDSAGRSLVGLVNDILDYAKIEAGKLQIESTPFNLRELISETTQMFSLPVHDNRSLLLSLVNDDVPIVVEGDQTRIRQVLINLIGNAVKFTHDGWIEVRVSCRKFDGNAVTLRFEVQDSGIGLSPSEQRQLFAVFSQASADVARRYGGTGLGLSISRELVRLMGGDIDLISARNWGSTFWFDLTLPVVEQDGASVPQLVPLTDPVLLIDVSGCMGRIVSAGGHLFDSVRTVASLDAAYEALSSDDSYALVVIHYDGSGAAAGAPQSSSSTPHDAQYLERLLRRLLPLKSQPFRLATGVKGHRVAFSLPGNCEVDSVITRSVFDLAQLLNVFRVDGAETTSADTLTAEVTELATFPDLRVLVAEDNSVNQLVTQGYLRKLGINSELAEDGRAAVHRYRERQGRFDVILMDLDMPLMDGPAATRQIRALEEANSWPRRRILALSAHALPEYNEQVIAAGMDGQLVKPVTLQQLADALGEVDITRGSG